MAHQVPRMAGKKYVGFNWTRQIQEPFMASNLTDFKNKGRAYCEIPTDKAVQVVLEENGAPVKDDKAFHALGTWCKLMLLTDEQKWTPEVPIVFQSFPCSRIPVNLSSVQECPQDLSRRLSKGGLTDEEKSSNLTESEDSSSDYDSDDDLGKEYAEGLIKKILVETDSVQNKFQRIHRLVRPLELNDLREIIYASCRCFPDDQRSLVWEIQDTASVFY